MKIRFFYLFQLSITFCAISLLGQHEQYLLKDYPAVFNNIEQYLLQDDIDSVFKLSNLVLQNENNPNILAIAHFYIGQAEEMSLQYGLAHSSYNNASKFFIETNNMKGLALVNAQKANLMTQEGKFTEAQSFYNQSIQNSKGLKLCGILIDVYQKKANFQYSIQAVDSAFYYLRKALNCAVLIKNEDQQINIINQISTNYHSLGALDSAIFYFQKSLFLKQDIEDPEGLISDYSALGKLYRERGDYENAQQQLMEAMNIAKIEQDSFSMTTIYAEFGDIYAAQKIWNVSEDYYKKALHISQRKESPFMAAECLKKLGLIFQDQKIDSLAIENYEASLVLYTKLKNKVNAAEVLVHLSSLYNNKTQFEKAKTLLQESLKSSSRSQDVMSTLTTKLALANIEVKLGNYDIGIGYAEECRKSFKVMEDKENLRKVYFILSQAYSHKGNYQKAYHYYQDYSMIKDSLVSVERAEAIKKYDLLTTTKKKDEEIAEQNERIQNQKVVLLRKNNQLLLLTGGLGFIALITSLLFFVYRKNKQINHQIIQVLEKEKETQTMKSIIEGEEQERKRFSRELHDGLGAVLATVKMQISGIPKEFPLVQSSKTYQKAESLIDGACRTVREISHDLMPYVLEQQGLLPAIEDMCQNLSSQHDISFDFIPFGEESKLNDVTKITLYRITQELLKNIIKYAHATEVIVQVTIEENVIILIVEDNGIGFDLSIHQKGIGIENIRSRAEYLNGTLDIDSKLNQGSTFTIQLPKQHQ